MEEKDSIYIGQLIGAHLAGTLTPGEQVALDEWTGASPANQRLFQRLCDREHLRDELGIILLLKTEDARRKIRERLYDEDTPGKPASHPIFYRRWGWIAAIFIACLATGSYIWLSSRQPVANLADRSNAIISPGGNGAVLTLSDGSQILLDSLKDQVVALQGGVQVKMVNGSLQYAGKGDRIVYNTVTTPRKRQFHLILPDGTKVWLNAASSIRYPATFAGRERRVEIKGEAYFEVAHRAGMPFRVSAKDNATIEVLGTAFNINAYDNENSVNTTLVEGAVRVNTIILRPGQQLQVFQHKKPVLTDKADIAKITAWKKGFFNFDGVTLKEAMRQLERWYDIDVVYVEGVPDIVFGGGMTRNISLEGLLLALQKSDVHFRLEGRKLFVLP